MNAELRRIYPQKVIILSLYSSNILFCGAFAMCSLLMFLEQPLFSISLTGDTSVNVLNKRDYLNFK